MAEMAAPGTLARVLGEGPGPPLLAVSAALYGAGVALDPPHRAGGAVTPRRARSRSGRRARLRGHGAQDAAARGRPGGPAGAGAPAVPAALRAACACRARPACVASPAGTGTTAASPARGWRESCRPPTRARAHARRREDRRRRGRCPWRSPPPRPRSRSRRRSASPAPSRRRGGSRAGRRPAAARSCASCPTCSTCSASAWSPGWRSTRRSGHGRRAARRHAGRRDRARCSATCPWGRPAPPPTGRSSSGPAPPELARTVAALLQAEELGAPLSRALEGQAEALRVARRQAARDRAARAAPKIQLVVALHDGAGGAAAGPRGAR